MKRRQLPRLAAIALLALAGAASASAEPPPRLHAATRISVPPVIDGDLRDPCWQATDWCDDFQRVITAAGAPRAATRARFCFDQATLYIGIECSEPDMAGLRDRLARGLATVFSEDIEIFLDENRNRTTYHHFAVGVDGSRYQAFVSDRNWTCDWKSAVRLGTTGYTVELAIPFAGLQAALPGPTAAWGMNVCRTRNVPPPELTAWSKTPDGFHNPGHFGLLVFAPYAEWLADSFADTASARAKAMAALCAEYPLSTADQRHYLKDALTRCDHFRRAVPRPLDTEAAARPWYERGTQLLREIDEMDQRLRLAVIAGEFR